MSGFRVARWRRDVDADVDKSGDGSGTETGPGMTETDTLGAELDELGDRGFVGCAGCAGAKDDCGSVGEDWKVERWASELVAGRTMETGWGHSEEMAVWGVDFKAGGVSGGGGADAGGAGGGGADAGGTGGGGAVDGGGGGGGGGCGDVVASDADGSGVCACDGVDAGGVDECVGA